MLSVEEKEITITNVRTQMQTQYTPEELVREVRVLCPIDKTPEQAWFDLYGRPLEQSEPEPPKQVEILTKGKPPKVAPSGRGRTLDCMGRSYAPGKERSKCDAQSTGRQRNPRPDEHGDGLRRRHGEDKNDDTEGRVLLVWQDRPDRGAPLFWRTESQIV